MPSNDLLEQHTYLGALLMRLHAHTRGIDTAQTNERGLDYCEVYNHWFALNPAKEPTVTKPWLDSLGVAIRSKAKKWGVKLDYGPATGPVSPNACEYEKLRPDIGIWGQTAGALDDVLHATDGLLKNLGVALPWLIGLSVVSRVGSILDLFGGRRRR